MTRFSLPAVAELERRARVVAFVDTTIEPDFAARYFDFDPSWAPGERLFTMRSGEGDEAYAWFGRAGAFVFGRHRAKKHVARATLIRGLPKALTRLTHEKAFDLDNASFATWCGARETSWRSAVDPETGGISELLRVLDGDPKSFATHVRHYYGRRLDARTLGTLWRGEPVTAKWLSSVLGPASDLTAAFAAATKLGVAVERTPIATQAEKRANAAAATRAKLPPGAVRHGRKVLVPDSAGRLADAEYKVVRDGDEVFLIVNDAVQMSATGPNVYVDTIEAVRAVLRSAGGTMHGASSRRR